MKRKNDKNLIKTRKKESLRVNEQASKESQESSPKVTEIKKNIFRVVINGNEFVFEVLRGGNLRGLDGEFTPANIKMIGKVFSEFCKTQRENEKITHSLQTRGSSFSISKKKQKNNKKITHATQSNLESSSDRKGENRSVESINSFVSSHSLEKDISLSNLAVRYIPFEILPSGSWSTEHIIAYYQKLERLFGKKFDNSLIDSKRFKYI